MCKITHCYLQLSCLHYRHNRSDCRTFNCVVSTIGWYDGGCTNSSHLRCKTKEGHKKTEH